MSWGAFGGRIEVVLAILNIGPLELLLLGAAAVLLFGGDLPDVARKAARMAGRLRGMTNDLTREFRENTDFEGKLRRPPELDKPPIQKNFSVSDWRPVNSPPRSEELPIEVVSEGDVGPDAGLGKDGGAADSALADAPDADASAPSETADAQQTDAQSGASDAQQLDTQSETGNEKPA